MKTLQNWSFKSRDNNRIDLLVNQKHLFSLFVLEDDIIRVFCAKGGTTAFDRTWSICPGQTDVAWEGRDKFDLSGFSLPEYEFKQEGATLSITTSKIRCVVHNDPLWLEWFYLSQDKEWLPLAADRKTGAYFLGLEGTNLEHFQQRYGSERFYGLGEKAGDLNRAGRRFEMRSLDAMGYDAEKTDPLYKHVPFYITQRNGASFGLFYDNFSSSWFHLGDELDNYHAWYTRYGAEAGDLDYYFIFSPSIQEITKRYVWMLGGNIFLPKWSLGYSGSTMSYTDAPDAQTQLLKFIELCKKHNIPSDSFQMSSGYTQIGTKRYVFNWNYDKIPEPKKMTAAFRQAGIHLAANIKPCLLQDHPKYKDCRDQGLFIKDSESDEPERSVFWDDVGSHLDFTNPKTVSWWKANVTEQLLERGIESTWNDNNEYVVWDGNARCHGFGKQTPIKLIRPLMSLFMMRASWEAQTEYAPSTRPYLISRSGCPGMQRYVQTWSGDNRTEWKTLRYNTRMGLGMSLSGMYNTGHDVGGFSGPKPEEELFIRWVQNGVLHPRFTIHSWNDDKTANEPWMYPRATPIIREAINLRYRLMPYLYTKMWESVAHLEPMLRPTFFDHEHDEQAYVENDDYFMGKDLLVASVVEKGATTRSVYLPDNGSDGWYCWHSGQWFSSAQTVTLPAPIERLPLLVRGGSVIPLSSRLAHVAEDKNEVRTFALFPHMGAGERVSSYFEDDGESYDYKQDRALWMDLALQSTPEALQLTITRKGSYQPLWQKAQFTLPQGEERPLYVNGQRIDNNKEYSFSVFFK